MEQTVFVGLSGGVDSAVSATRLQAAGYNVVGVFIKVWHPDFLDCHWEAERLDAMRVAAHLQIPFLTCDAQAAYKRDVADYFIAEYAAGRTPNPDVMCNQQVKFGAFLQFAREQGANYIATGHYAQIEANKDGSYWLKRGVDTDKDQSYFLWTLTQTQLAASLFPVGGSKKATIREEAGHLQLPVAAKKDSQGICFLGQVDIKDFLGHFVTLTPGAVLDEHGTTIGQHGGALTYTLGQRHGFRLYDNDNAQTPRYVIGKDLAANTITIAATPPTITPGTSLSLRDVTLHPSVTAQTEFVCEAQFRYRQTPVSVLLQHTPVGWSVTPQGEADRPAAGQSCVLYRGEYCLGGGIID